MNDIRREFTPHIRPNDCWALVLSRVSGKAYSDIYAEMIKKGYIDEVGLRFIPTGEVLRQYGYYPIQLYVPRQRPLIRHVLNTFYDYEVVIASMNTVRNLPHLSYAHKGVDYTTSETDESMNDRVLYLWIKGYGKTDQVVISSQN